MLPSVLRLTGEFIWSHRLKPFVRLGIGRRLQVTSNKVEKIYTVSQAAQLLGVVVKTMQRWDREGRLKAFRTQGGRRFYTDALLMEFMGVGNKRKETLE